MLTPHSLDYFLKLYDVMMAANARALPCGTWCHMEDQDWLSGGLASSSDSQKDASDDDGTHDAGVDTAQAQASGSNVQDVHGHARTILHVDMYAPRTPWQSAVCSFRGFLVVTCMCLCRRCRDCFYAQCEMVKEPSLRGRPMGVTQKYLVVTCNYPARGRGVGKLMRIDKAKAVCPELVLRNGEDLTEYRDASRRLLAVMREYSDAAERLGLDEVFLDVSAQVSALQAAYRSRSSRRGSDEAAQAVQVPPAPVFEGHVVGDATSSAMCSCGCTERLQYGSMLLAEVRRAIFEDMGCGAPYFLDTGSLAAHHAHVWCQVHHNRRCWHVQNAG